MTHRIYSNWGEDQILGDAVIRNINIPILTLMLHKYALGNKGNTMLK